MGGPPFKGPQKSHGVAGGPRISMRISMTDAGGGQGRTQRATPTLRKTADRPATVRGIRPPNVPAAIPVSWLPRPRHRTIGVILW